MKEILFSIACISLLLIVFGCGASTKLRKNNMPRSMEAVKVEDYNSAEVAVRAKGLGLDEERIIDDAEDDAQKAAVYFILFGTSTPILQNTEERNNFEAIQESFFDINNIKKYIPFIGNDILKRVKLSRGVKVEKYIRVDKQRLMDDLVTKGVIQSRNEIEKLLGSPTIMVIPEANNVEQSLQLYEKNDLYKKGAAVVKSYLADRKYKYFIPSKYGEVRSEIQTQKFLNDIIDNDFTETALKFEQDIYITYHISVDQQQYGTQVTVNCDAFETTSGQQLATKIGYSERRPSTNKEALVHEAMNNAMEGVLLNIKNYWKDFLKDGVPYLVNVSIAPEFDEDKIEDIQFAFKEAAEKIAIESQRPKKKLESRNTIEYIIWCDPNKYFESDKVYKKLKNSFNKLNLGTLGKVKTLNRLLLLKISQR